MKNILPTLALSLALASCTDTCLDSGAGQGNQADPTAQAHHLSTSQVLLCLLGTTADVDSIPDDWATTNFQAEPTLGIASSEANPYERLVVVPNATEACRLYKAMTSSPFTGEAQSSTWTRDSIGTLRFNVENQTDLYATLDVDVKQLPHLRQLRFVPQSVLGQNAETNYYTVGDVILQQNPDEAPTYYMCVRPAIEGVYGRSHWCSLQLNDAEQKNPNLKEFESKHLILPTKLSTDQGKAQVMLQHYFNELRYFARPDLYAKDDATTLGDLTPAQFTTRQLRDLLYMWDDQDVWEKISPADLRTLLAEDQLALHAFYYGYTKHFNLLSANTYDVYTLNLYTARIEDGEQQLTDYFATAIPSQVETTKTLGLCKNFDYINTTATMPFDLNDDANNVDNIREGTENVYVVKHRTGAQLDSRLLSTNDYNPHQSFALRTDKNHITDVVVQGQMQKKQDEVGLQPFFAFGDEVVHQGSKINAICVRQGAAGEADIYDDPDAEYAYFLADANKLVSQGNEWNDFINGYIGEEVKPNTTEIGDASKTPKVSFTTAKQISLVFLDAYLRTQQRQTVAPIVSLVGNNKQIYEAAAEHIYDMAKTLRALKFNTATDENQQTYYAVQGVYNTNYTNALGDITYQPLEITLKYYPKGRQGNAPDGEYVYTTKAVNDPQSWVVLLPYVDKKTFTESFSQDRALIEEGGAQRRSYKAVVNELYKDGGALSVSTE